MEHQFQPFGPLDEDSVFRRNSETAQTGLKRIVVYILYCILVLLLLIQLMVTGIKFTQLNKEITDINVQMKSIKNERMSSSSGATQDEDFLLKEIVPIRGSCREGWASFKRSCYWLSSTTATWQKAEETCRSHSGHLLVVNSAEEMDFISQIVVVAFDYWIGLVEPHHEGKWTWVDGTDFSSTPTFWDQGQPDNWDFRENGEDCGQLHASVGRTRKLWNDADCNLSYGFICETKA
ncbi:hypothetical protein OJAV_G00093170 [Oryzias javanicus]|uniref:C-type lectin domain-containing protein n=1 Tax=Oryzias javanicus TaxID=123683 RepID=A0A437D1E1_ORYJA|nr:hypothetical protein OJAV_G00093170 [Oryzias javanicus]